MARTWQDRRSRSGQTAGHTRWNTQRGYRRLRTSLKVIGCTLAYLIVFGVIAAVVSSLLETREEIISSTGFFRSNFLPADFSVAAFVFGVLCGYFNYMTAGEIIAGTGGPDWTDRQDSARIGLGVICATVALLLVFLVPFRIISGDSLLDSIPLTMTYFLSVLATELFCHFV